MVYSKRLIRWNKFILLIQGKQRFELSGSLVAHNEQLKKKLDLRSLSIYVTKCFRWEMIIRVIYTNNQIYPFNRTNKQAFIKTRGLTIFSWYLSGVLLLNKSIQFSLCTDCFKPMKQGFFSYFVQQLGTNVMLFEFKNFKNNFPQ